MLPEWPVESVARAGLFMYQGLDKIKSVGAKLKICSKF
jgi:hypothetical protein